MPRAEVGTTKHLNNKLKSKGLQRLRWYCQPCERQMRDENGFKCHCQSESHVRTMLLVGEDPKKHIQDFSNQFQRDFLQLLKTSHGEKKVQINHFYQTYIQHKEHVHMNATKWPSLTEFAKHLGREGICRVEETDKGLHISWMDNSPEALRRQDAIRRKERQDKGDEEREQKLIREQIERAKMDSEAKSKEAEGEDSGSLQRAEGEKVKLNFGAQPIKPKQTAGSTVPSPGASKSESPSESGEAPKPEASKSETSMLDAPKLEVDQTPPVEPVSLKMAPSKPKNVFASAKKNPLGSKKAAPAKTLSAKPMSEAERIMKEEIERKRSRGSNGFGGPGLKRQRVV
ncbi:MAG: hypothetical protein M4579_005730 [Chaenotheca gracillima]|nr:MAG: hypothetical protein M4579_005730 [Chaenotheca gracillima]